MATPPVGLNALVRSSDMVKSAPTDLILRGVLWFLVTDLVVMAVVIAMPGFNVFLTSDFS